MSRPGANRGFGAPLLGRDATVDGGTAALVAAAAAALLVGAATGSVAGTAAGVAGGVATVVGVIRADDADPLSRGVGSVALVVGAVLLARAMTLSDTVPGFLVVACGTLAVLAVAAETLPADGRPSFRPALYALAGSTGVLLLAGAVFFVGAPLLGFVLAGLTGVASVRGGRIPNVLLSLVVLQVLVVGLSLAIDRAKAVLERWIPRERAKGFAVLDRLGVEPSEIPRTLWAFLAAQTVLAFLVPGLVGAVLRATPPGEALYVLLTSGVLHLPLAVLLALFAGVVAAESSRRLLLRLGGYHPPTVIGLLAGGLVATAGVFAVALLAAAGLRVTAVLGAAGLPPADVGTGGNAVLSTAARTAVFTVFLGAGAWFGRHALGRVLTGAAVGAVLLFAAAVIGSEAGAHPVVVFAVVGLALVTFEAGGRSSRLSRRLGSSVDARSAELVHLIGSAIAIAAGIGLATAALYVAVPAAARLGDARGILLLLAGLVGLFAALLLLGRKSSTASG